MWLWAAMNFRSFPMNLNIRDVAEIGLPFTGQMYKHQWRMDSSTCLLFSYLNLMHEMESRWYSSAHNIFLTWTLDSECASAHSIASFQQFSLCWLVLLCCRTLALNSIAKFWMKHKRFVSMYLYIQVCKYYYLCKCARGSAQIVGKHFHVITHNLLQSGHTNSAGNCIHSAAENAMHASCYVTRWLVYTELYSTIYKHIA